MAKVPFAGFIGPAYKAASWKASTQRLVNMYLEADPEKGQVLYGTPGHAAIATVGASPILAMEPTPSGLVIVTGDGAYWVPEIQNGEFIGQVSLGAFGSPYAVVAQAGDQVMIVNGGQAWSFNRTDPVPALAAVAGPDFPTNPQSCCTLDGYFITHGPNDDRFFWSAPFDPQSWDALDFASAENVNDKLQRTITLERELYLIGAQSTEIWATTGDDNVFARISGTYIPHGTPAPLSAAVIGRAMMWLSQDANGGAVVMRARGLQAERVSTHAMEAEIAEYVGISDAFALTYQQRGHQFYCLTFLNAGKTWVFDTANDSWHERSSQVPDPSSPDQVAPISRIPGAWLPRCHAFFGGLNLVGSRTGPTVSQLSPLIASDNGVDIIRTRVSPHVFDQEEDITISGLELTFQPGVGDGTMPDEDVESGPPIPAGPASDPQAMLRVSKDGGRNYGPQRQVSIGKRGDYLARALWNRLGRGRDMVCEVTVSAQVPVAISAASLILTK